MGSEDFWPEPPSPHRRNAAGADIEQALNAASELKASAESCQSTASVIAIATSAATTVGAGLAAGEGAASHWVAMVVIVVILLVNIGVGYLMTHRLRAAMNLRERLANELVVVVRAVYTDVAEREQWGDIRTQTVVTRLSRFPIRPRHGHSGDRP